jgi:hypothetical protein
MATTPIKRKRNKMPGASVKPKPQIEVVIRYVPSPDGEHRLRRVYDLLLLKDKTMSPGDRK